MVSWATAMSSLKWTASAGSAGMIACIDIGPSPLMAISSGRKPEGTLMAGVAALFGAAMSVLMVSSVTSAKISASFRARAKREPGISI